MKKQLIYILLGVATLASSCSDSWLEEDPSDLLSVDGSVQTVTQAQYAIDGVYDQMSDDEYYNGKYIFNFDVMADDMRCSQVGRLDDDYRYTFTTEASDYEMWERPYKAMKNVASLLDIIDDVTTEGDADEASLNDIEGQALALRGLIHFDLVKTFGTPYTLGTPSSDLGVPIVTSLVDFDAKMARNTVAEVYTQVISDFKAGIELLSDDTNLGHINKSAAQALLARVYLYQGDYTNALAYAEEVIDNSGLSLMSRDNYVSEWASNGMSESLFEIVNSTEDNAGYESIGYLADPTGYGQLVASDDFIAKLQATPYDVRNDLLGEDELGRMGYVMKFPGNSGGVTYTSNVRVIRLSEVYLIAAEAALDTDPAKAATYLNAIIERAYPTESVYDEDGTTILFNYPTDVPTVTAATITLDKILDEKSLELVSEGQRFFDLVRNNKTIVRGSDYWGTTYKTVEPTDYKIIQPIPRIELDANSNMVQNTGYAD